MSQNNKISKMGDNMKEEERDHLAEALEKFEQLEAQAVDGITADQIESIIKQCFE
ncbi:hypothetical protein J1P26_07765 [Neobacillus sp. MM2021_6]|uniref:hypothetical protein n=1 Tax=Bacillaceae TaxID=186817 RepID=UPI00140D803B|nr:MULTISPECIES: hypothetical protein [Bacillaceae]MBO0959617.1 hypothetical protein [Neobacillus sp. MM2021_6]NHC20147.1 hypothetical protein [Bacillus sp. MM2020_4]WML38084.1 hypothetical protein RCG19_12675 [Neobacillus sp. OS1-2]